MLLFIKSIVKYISNSGPKTIKCIKLHKNHGKFKIVRFFKLRGIFIVQQKEQIINIVNNLKQMWFTRLSLLRIIANYTTNYPTPISINYYWNFGLLIGLVLIIYIIVGTLLIDYILPTIYVIILLLLCVSFYVVWKIFVLNNYYLFELLTRNNGFIKNINSNEQNKYQHYILCDVPEPWQFGFQDPATPIMEGIIEFHNDLMYFLIIIIIFILYFLIRIVYLFSNEENNIKRRLVNKSHDTFLEIVWTIIPTIILFIIITPSFALLYAMDEINEPELTIHVSGHQWYWHYELNQDDMIRHEIKPTQSVCADLADFADNIYSVLISSEYEYDSYLILDEDLNLVQLNHTPLFVSEELVRTNSQMFSIFNNSQIAFDVHFLFRVYNLAKNRYRYNEVVYVDIPNMFVYSPLDISLAVQVDAWDGVLQLATDPKIYMQYCSNTSVNFDNMGFKMDSSNEYDFSTYQKFDMVYGLTIVDDYELLKWYNYHSYFFTKFYCNYYTLLRTPLHECAMCEGPGGVDTNLNVFTQEVNGKPFSVISCDELAILYILLHQNHLSVVELPVYDNHDIYTRMKYDLFLLGKSIMGGVPELDVTYKLPKIFINSTINKDFLFVDSINKGDVNPDGYGYMYFRYFKNFAEYSDLDVELTISGYEAWREDALSDRILGELYLTQFRIRLIQAVFTSVLPRYLADWVSIDRLIPFYDYSCTFKDYCYSDAGLKIIPIRLLTVDAHLQLPIHTHIRLLITSGDVLHSWAVPSLGIKVDACPGRLNMVNIYIKRPGTYYGQCSEICGILHSYMPIVVTAFI